MTRLLTHGTRSPFRADHLSREDRSTYRRWARRTYLAYLVLIVLLAAGLSLHDRQGAQPTSQDPAAQPETVMVGPSHATGTGRKPSYF
ncbi:hypothetical protein [Bradyrhizobium sp. USDA 4454]